MAENARILYYYGRFEHGPKRHITMIACYTETPTAAGNLILIIDIDYSTNRGGNLG